MSAAARHLTPVTLECGGKSPVFIDRSANLGLAVTSPASPANTNKTFLTNENTENNSTTGRPSSSTGAPTSVWQ